MKGITLLLPFFLGAFSFVSAAPQDADSAIVDIIARAVENGELENLINKRDVDIDGIPHGGVTCPRTPKANKPDKSPGKQKITKEEIEADIKDYAKQNPSKKDGYPKKFDDDHLNAGDFDFDNGCDKSKVLELPVGPAGQKWKDMGSDPGDFRLMIQVTKDNEKVTFCGAFAHASPKDMGKFTKCTNNHI
ncbi:MAG: hypothetical protein M1812_004436 [Candelaria pacifica]|nr:MAG: hypothetical protein M1812_004436 [Candelaria pacifica]